MQQIERQDFDFRSIGWVRLGSPQVEGSSSIAEQFEPDTADGIVADYRMSHLDALEAEAVYVFREAAAELEKPVLLFSGGKDSAVLLRLAEKAFRPGRFPFPVLHVDTGHNFPEAIAYRDRRVAELGERLIVAGVQESIDRGRVREQPGPNPSRNRLQTVTLLDAIAEHGFDCAFGQWDPKNQRPELWSLYNARTRRGEHVRVFPISNWTELDVWQYVKREKLDLPSIYYAHTRPVFEENGLLMAVGAHYRPTRGEPVFEAEVRYRTVGDMTCTAAVRSSARTLDQIIRETAAARVSERGATRADDRTSQAAMEDRKREGYF